MRRKFIFLAFAAPLFVSACGTAEPKESPTPRSKVSSAFSVGTRGELIPINSSNVIAAGFDSNTLVMTIKFKNGALYEYYDVPTNLWEDFVAAQPHPWSQVGYPRLAQAGIRYRRIG